MADLEEQCACIKFPFNFRKILYKLLKAPCGKQIMGRIQFVWVIFQVWIWFCFCWKSWTFETFINQQNTWKYGSSDRTCLYKKKLLPMKLLKFWEFDLGQFKQFLKTIWTWINCHQIHISCAEWKAEAESCEHMLGTFHSCLRVIQNSFQLMKRFWFMTKKPIILPWFK